MLWIAALAQGDDLRSAIRSELVNSDFSKDVRDHLTSKGLSADDANSLADSAETQLADCVLASSEHYSENLGIPKDDFVRGILMEDPETARNFDLQAIEIDRFLETLEPCFFEFASATGYEVPVE
jgi:hypothetical protein